MKTHLRAGDHEGVSHIVARITEIRKFKSLERALLLFDGEKVREHLRGVELVSQAVPDRNARVLCQFLNDFLTEAAVLNAVIHPAQNLRGVRDGLLLSHLAAARVEIRHAHTKVPARDFERAACARRRFLKQQNNIFALQVTMGRSGALEIFKITRQIEQVSDLRRRVVDELQKMSSSDVGGHKIYLL